ncbi:MAG: hypothetical protein V1702_00775 [Candidatus Woesearchaeota archaeon]
MNNELYKKLANYEIGWWKAHHRRDSGDLIHQMTKLYELQYEIPYDKAREAVDYRIQATKEHDIAEKFEDAGDQTNADIHWSRAEKLVEHHFRILMEHLRPENNCI